MATKTLRGREIWTVQEHTPSGIPIDKVLEDGRLNVYEQVLTGDFFNIRLQADQLLISARGHLGLIPLNDQVGVLIEPRVPIGNLSRVLEIAKYTPTALEPFKRGYKPSQTAPRDLLPVLARSFLNAVEEVLTNGLFRTYQNVREHTSFPRGRILMGQTLKKHHAKGQTQRAAVSRFERTPDNAPNRLIKYALWFLSQVFQEMESQGGILRLKARLNQRFQDFRGVALDHDRAFLSDTYVRNPEQLPRSRDYYEQAIRLGTLLVRSGGIRFDSSHGNIPIASLLIKMSDAFEDYLREVLRADLEDDTRLRVLDGNIEGKRGAKQPLFTDRQNPEATPDIVIQSSSEEKNGEEENGEVRKAVVEIKYRPTSNLPLRRTINQVITYAASYDSPLAIVVNLTEPGTDSSLQEIGTVGSTKLFRYAYSLAGELEPEEKKFCESIRSALVS